MLTRLLLIDDKSEGLRRLAVYGLISRCSAPLLPQSRVAATSVALGSQAVERGRCVMLAGQQQER